MLSTKVACWFLDDQDMPQEITPSIVTAGTFSIALISGAILLGREGRCYHGKFNKDDLISYLDGGQAQSDIDTLENWLKQTLDISSPYHNKDSFFHLAIEKFKSPGRPDLPRHQFDLNWKIVTDLPEYKHWSKGGRRKGT